MVQNPCLRNSLALAGLDVPILQTLLSAHSKTLAVQQLQCPPNGPFSSVHIAGEFRRPLSMAHFLWPPGECTTY